MNHRLLYRSTAFDVWADPAYRLEEIEAKLRALIAQCQEVTRQHIYVWRHELRRKGLQPPRAGATYLLLA